MINDSFVMLSWYHGDRFCSETGRSLLIIDYSFKW